jgi:CubicO group peptidase (beta-lactamase class C family)
MWNIGPITQGFAAVAVMQLKEAGKPSVDDPSPSICPDVPEAWGKVTIL